MQNKKIKRLGAAFLAAAMVLQSFSGMANVSAAESTQMTSEKEVVYANVYSDTARELDFNDNWKFYLGDASGAEGKNFDDSAWRNVNVPHDYSIEQEYTSAGEAESGYLLGGTGWYRKHFTLSEDLRGKEIRIDFGGVYMNATVWVNGTQLGTHPFGYTPFSFDITDYVKIGEENVITVKVDHQTPSSRWYSGSGIYRSVNLTVMNPVHVDLYGTKISTPNLETEKDGTVNMEVKTTVANAGSEDQNVVLTHTVYEKGTENSIGTVTTSAQAVKAGEAKEITAILPANKPALWDTKNPNLYTVVTEVKVGADVADTYETEYGFRYIKFDTNTGFYLNGEPVKLKGVCMHHDQGALGSEAHYRAIERQVEILQEMGCNSIRVTHNPAADELIEICNEKGILVIDEFFDGWMYAKNGNRNDYSVWFQRQIESGNQILGAESGMTWAEFDMKATIGRGENSPAVIMWSLGNEIQEGAGGSGYNTMARNLIAWAQETGTTKTLTIGSNAVKNYSAEHVDIANQLTAVGGTSGTNYSGGSSYDSLHSSYPDWFLYGSETASHVNSRGVYNVTGSQQLNADKALTSYDYSAVGWGATASSAWYDVITRDFVAGEYVWTGFDYIGEPTPNNGTGTGWVNGADSPKNSFFGIVDTAGLPKDNYYFYQSQWNDEVNTLHVLPAWNRDVLQNPNNVPVVVYSDAASVKLTLTTEAGQVKDLGTKTFVEKTTAAGYKYQMASASSTNHRDMYLTWNVPFEAGTITATAYDKAGNEIKDTVGRSFVTTTGDEAKLEAIVDRDTIKADGKDLAYITVNVTDANGNIVPDAKNNVTFHVEGDGVLVGVDNGKQSDHQSFQDDNRDAFSGSLVAIVQSTKEAGTFTVTASAAGLQSDSVTVTTESTGAGGDVSFLMSKNYYVKVGNAPKLPATIETTLADGSVKDLAVVWDKIDAADYAKAGTFAVAGVLDGKYSVSVTVNMIDEVGGLLNYSATTSVGVEPSLPAARPAVLVDGTILDAAFPVEWDAVAESDYAEEGTFVVDGVADVFGTEIEVTASIRVQAPEVSVGESISYQAAKLYQDIEENLQSDTLAAIKDGATAIGANNDGGANETAWSNYDASQAGDNTAELTFEYDTQQRFAEIVIHFWKDNYAAEFPDAGTTKISISETGNEGSWVEVEAEETMGTEKDRVKPYTYTFDAVSATFVKIAVTNSTAAKTAKACTGITEVELKKAVTSDITANASTGLSALRVNGVNATEGELATGTYYTLDKEASVRATGKDNAAVTVLPAYNDAILVITEAENHIAREVFTIFLGQERPASPDDASRDYPVSDLVAISDSQYLPGTTNEGPDDYILDGQSGTWWHTNWQTSEATDVAKRWVGVSLKEATEIAGIRYMSRGGNGDVTSYRVEYRTTDNGTWTEITSGTFHRNGGWQLVTFPTVEAKQIRVVGVHTYADSGNDAHMSTAEFRVIVPKNAEEPTETPKPTEEPTELQIIPVEKLTATAGSEEALSESNQNEGPADFALDGDESTKWHTEWVGTKAENLWIQFEIDGSYEVTGLTYLPRTDAGGQYAFGVITTYKVQVSNDGETWEDAVSGKWNSDAELKIVTFEGQQVKYVRLFAEEATNDGRLFASAAEIRLLGFEKPATEVTPTVEPTEEPTVEPTEEPTVEPTEEPTPEVTETPVVTEEPTPEVTETPVVTEEPTPEVTETPAVTEEPTPEVTETPVVTEEPTPEATETPVVTEEPTVEPTETQAPEPTETQAPQPTETEAPEPKEDVTTVFDDVYEDWYTDYVQYVYDNNLMTGIKGTKHFAPNDNITKAQVAQVLYNMEGQPAVEDQSVFTDLKDVYDAEWYAAAVAWAYDNEIVTGDLNTKEFSPNADVTREQLTLMMFRYAKFKEYDVTATSDYEGLVGADKISNWAADGVSWAVGKGLISGVEKDGVKDIAAQGNATRAQVAAILQRFCEAYK